MSQVQGSANRPIITGRPDAVSRPGTPNQATQSRQGTSFQEILQQRLQSQQTQEITLSKHAQLRTEQRGIALDEMSLERLGQAVKLAADKGLKDTLVMMDNNAFIVNVPSRVIVTVVGGDETENTVFTNIDGAVIL